MKNFRLPALLILLIVGLSSCASLRESRSAYVPHQHIVERVSMQSYKSRDRMPQNEAVTMGYWNLAEELEVLIGTDQVSLPRLNAWASLSIGHVLQSPPVAAKITDAVGVTHLAKTLARGNNHIYHYVSSQWRCFVNYCNRNSARNLDSLWSEITHLYPEMADPTELQRHPNDGRHYSYHSFRCYLDAMQTTDSTLVREYVLLGNLYFMLGEQTVAQEFLRKALTLRPFGSNPFNLLGRQCGAQVGSQAFFNTGFEPYPQTNFRLEELNSIVSSHPYEGKPVTYHKYEERIPFLFQIGLYAQEDPFANSAHLFDRHLPY